MFKINKTFKAHNFRWASTSPALVKATSVSGSHRVLRLVCTTWWKQDLIILSCCFWSQKVHFPIDVISDSFQPHLSLHADFVVTWHIWHGALRKHKERKCNKHVYLRITSDNTTYFNGILHLNMAHEHRKQFLGYRHFDSTLVFTTLDQWSMIIYFNQGRKQHMKNLMLINMNKAYGTISQSITSFIHFITYSVYDFTQLDFF